MRGAVLEDGLDEADVCRVAELKWHVGLAGFGHDEAVFGIGEDDVEPSNTVEDDSSAVGFAFDVGLAIGASVLGKDDGCEREALDFLGARELRVGDGMIGGHDDLAVFIRDGVAERIGFDGGFDFLRGNLFRGDWGFTFGGDFRFVFGHLFNFLSIEMRCAAFGDPCSSGLSRRGTWPRSFKRNGRFGMVEVIHVESGFLQVFLAEFLVEVPFFLGGLELDSFVLTDLLEEEHPPVELVFLGKEAISSLREADGLFRVGIPILGFPYGDLPFIEEAVSPYAGSVPCRADQPFGNPFEVDFLGPDRDAVIDEQSTWSRLSNNGCRIRDTLFHHWLLYSLLHRLGAERIIVSDFTTC